MNEPMDIRRTMEEGPPCSSRAIDASVRFGVAGLAWGMLVGQYEARKEGYRGAARAIHVAKLVASCGLQCGCYAGVYSAANCGIERYRRKKDWMNASIAGATTGVVIAARTRSLMQIFGHAIVLSTLTTVVECLKPADDNPWN